MRSGAAAIKYVKGREAPFLVCKGRHGLAECLIRFAEDAGVPIKTDPALLEGLLVLEPGEMIPEELYSVVAQVLAFVYAQEEGTTHTGSGRDEEVASS